MVSVWHQSTARANRKHRIHLLSYRSHGILMSYTDDSVQGRLNSNAPIVSDTRRSPLTCVTGFSDTCHWKPEVPPEVSLSIAACANGVCASDVTSLNVKTAARNRQTTGPQPESAKQSRKDKNVNSQKRTSYVHMKEVTRCPRLHLKLLRELQIHINISFLCPA